MRFAENGEQMGQKGKNPMKRKLDEVTKIDDPGKRNGKTKDYILRKVRKGIKKKKKKGRK